jgi:hypothetical protein
MGDFQKDHQSGVFAVHPRLELRVLTKIALLAHATLLANDRERLAHSMSDRQTHANRQLAS